MSALDILRGIPLNAIMTAFGGEPDPKDPRNWRTAAGRITVTGEKFFNHDQGIGGGGAIDLAMHLGDMRFKDAIAYLGTEFGNVRTIEQYKYEAEKHAKKILDTTKVPKLSIPKPDFTRINRVVRYLTEIRGISSLIVKDNISKNNIWSDTWGNACFALRDMKGALIGAELRGTYEKPYHGSRGEKGLFYCGKASADNKKAAFTESSIDALSYLTLQNTNILVVSTTGNQKYKMVETAQEMVKRGYQIIAAFDNDKTGKHLSEILEVGVLDCNGKFKRDCPPHKDWNVTLQLSKNIIKQQKNNQNIKKER